MVRPAVAICLLWALCSIGCSALKQMAAMRMDVDPRLKAAAKPMTVEVQTEGSAISSLKFSDFEAHQISIKFSKRHGYAWGSSAKQKGDFVFTFDLHQTGTSKGQVVCEGRFDLKVNRQFERGEVGLVCGMENADEAEPRWYLELNGLSRFDLTGRYYFEGSKYRIASSNVQQYQGLQTAMVMGYHVSDANKTVIAAIETAAKTKTIWVAPDHLPLHESLARAASALIIFESIVPYVPAGGRSFDKIHGDRFKWYPGT